MQGQVVQILETIDYPQEIRRGAEVLAAGKLVVVPTETVYGFAGVLTHPDARAALGALRKSPAGKPFTVHLAEPKDAEQYLPITGGAISARSQARISNPSRGAVIRHGRSSLACAWSRWPAIRRAGASPAPPARGR